MFSRLPSRSFISKALAVSAAGVAIGANAANLRSRNATSSTSRKHAKQSSSCWTEKIQPHQEQHLASAEGDAASQYDIYYKDDGKGSIYNNRFGANAVLPREQDILEQSFRRVTTAKENGTLPNAAPLKIWDFGCGNGRLWPVYRDIAEKAAAQGREIELIAYDPSREGLHCFQEQLQKAGAAFIGENRLNELDAARQEGKRGYVAANMKLGNINIRFVHCDIQDTREHTLSLVGEEHHMIATMFGSFAHIAGREQRQEKLQMFEQALHPDGEFILNVPTQKSFQAELITYDTLRSQYNGSVAHRVDAHAERLAFIKSTEDGDIYYCKFGENLGVANYYHIFTGKELEEEMQKAGFTQKGNIDISSIGHPSEVSQNALKAKADEWLSWMWPSAHAPYQWTERAGNYIVAIGGKGDGPHSR